MSATLKLYETLEGLDILDELIAEHADRIAALGGDIEQIPEIAELLAFAEGQFEGAVERWGLKVRTPLAETLGVQMEIDRLQAMANQKSNAAKRLKEYLKRQLDARAITNVKTPLVTVRIQKNAAPAVSASSESVIEELYASGSRFAAQKVEYILNRDAILTAEKAGEALPDGIMVARGTHIRIA